MLSPISSLLTGGIIFAFTTAAERTCQSWPNGPFRTNQSSIVGADGARVTYAGVNWSGASETMVPEGLQYQSIETIVGRIKSLGMNAIRLTYATEMIDQIYDHDMIDVPLKTAFTNALGVDNGTQIFE
ncbi:unnamed protein product [Discula destructiva]